MKSRLSTVISSFAVSAKTSFIKCDGFRPLRAGRFECLLIELARQKASTKYAAIFTRIRFDGKKVQLGFAVIVRVRCWHFSTYAVALMMSVNGGQSGPSGCARRLPKLTRRSDIL